MRAVAWAASGLVMATGACAQLLSFSAAEELDTEWRFWNAYNSGIPAPPEQFGNPSASNLKAQTGRTSLSDAASPYGGAAVVRSQITADADLKAYARAETTGQLVTGRMWSAASGRSASGWRATSGTLPGGQPFAGAFNFSFEGDLTIQPSSTVFLDFASVSVGFRVYYPEAVEGTPGASYSGLSVLNHNGLVQEFDSQGGYYDIHTGVQTGVFAVTVSSTAIANGWHVSVAGSLPVGGVIGGFNAVDYSLDVYASAHGDAGVSVADFENTGSFSFTGPGDIVFEPGAVPEPSAALLLALGGLAALSFRRRHRARR
ncbi:MAG: PEP-CTERM sorting domain-containing protein [Lentisphaerae bacterium]|nr:PEP-CTERM sorting domain-containing protein [Lentisphaerota bacterium]